MTPIYVKHAIGGVLVAVGRGAVSTTPFVLGTTKPSAANTGATGTLTPSSGDLTITTANYDLSGLDIFGFVKVRAAGCHGTNFRVRGSGPGITNTALIDCNHAAATGASFSNVTLIPDFPSIWLNSIIGHDYTVIRGLMLNGVDGAGMYNSNTPAAVCNTRLEGCYIDQLTYSSPDANHTDNRTHNDGVQIQGNTGHAVVGCTVAVFYDPATSVGADTGPAPLPASYKPSVTGQAIGITPNVSQVGNVVIDRNWIDAGAQSVTIIPGSVGVADSITITGNRFGRNQPNLTKNGVTARRAICIASEITLTGFPTTTGADTQGNVYEDDGSPVTVHRIPAATI